MSELIREANSEDYADVIRVWEASVRATHHFLDPEDITFYKSIIPEALPQVKLLFMKAKGTRLALWGFPGIHWICCLSILTIEGKELEANCFNMHNRSLGYQKLMLTSRISKP